MDFKSFNWSKLLDKRIIALVVFVFIYVIALKVTSINENLGMPDAVGHIAGFWSGLWDGLTSPISMMSNLGLIDDTVYDTYNSGIAYAYAYLLPVAIYGYILITAMIFSSNP